MARRKTVFGQIISGVQKAQADRRKAELAAQKAAAKAQADLEKEWEREQAAARKQQAAEQARREKEQEREVTRQAAERERRDREAARENAKRAADEEKQRLAQVREKATADKAAERESAQQAKDRQREAVERKLAEAAQRSEALNVRRTVLERVLIERDRGLVSHRPLAERALADEGADAFVAVVQEALRGSVHPDELGGSWAAVYRPEATELLIEYELPRQDVIPQVRAYRFVKTRDVMQPEPVKAAEIKSAYAQLVAKLVLRALAEVLDVTPPGVVESVTLNAYVSTKDRATGQPIRPCLISVAAERPKFGELVLDEPELDPVLCLRQFFNAIVSPHPYDLEAVRPVLEFDLSRYKFIKEVGVVAGLDSRPNLLDLKPVEFEHLVRELFEAIGMKSWVTQSSKDDGVDAVAVNEDPIVGGLCIIQAKRYKNIVGVESVNALAGVMEYKRAAKGVLVTTSWVGKASRDFAAYNGRIEIIEGRQLKSMLMEHLGLDVLIGLPKLPVGWAPEDIT